jgi:hypothetical protein
MAANMCTARDTVRRQPATIHRWPYVTDRTVQRDPDIHRVARKGLTGTQKKVIASAAVQQPSLAFLSRDDIRVS